MDLEPKKFFTLLHEYSDDENNGSKECQHLFSSLNDVLIQKQQNLTYLDLYLKHMFNKSQGFQEFIAKVVNKKTFKASVISVLEIIYTLINNFPSKLEKYIITIHDICLKVLKSSLASSDEKVKALQALNLSLEKIDKCFENLDDYNEIYNTLRNSLTIKKTDSVEGQIFEVLGTFAKNFQYLVKNHEDLKVLFLSQLDKQMIQKDLSNKMLCGLFTGLARFCESYPFELNTKEDEVIVGKLYKYIDRLSVPTSSVKIANRAALTFLANNMSLFVNLMTDKYKHWHETLLKWLDLGAEDIKVGVLVLGAYYKGLADYLVDYAVTDQKSVILYFMEYFRKQLIESKITHHEKKLCLHGLSSFSTVYHKNLSSEEVRDLFMIVIRTFEQTYILNPEPSTEILEYLPEYIQTMAKMMHFQRIVNSELFCLQKGVISMIKTFPQLPYSYHGNVVDSLVFTFYCLKSNNEKIFDNFIESTVYQGVVWTCSHQHISEAEIRQGNPKIVTIKNYVNVWKGLLTIVPNRKYDKSGIYLNDRKYILIKIIDKLVRTLIILINKLNISIILTETNAPLTDVQATYRVAEVNDFAIFLNVVDFYQEIFAQIDPTSLKSCISRLIQHLIEKCVKYPLISGFYKLLSFCLKICNSINYFNELSIDSKQDTKICYMSLTKFIEILLSKTKQYKGDLLIACLQVLLEYPTVLIRQMLPACIPSFKTIFSVGKNYIKLTNMALNTLEKWQKEISSDEMKPFLVEIIPYLDPYLQSKSLGGVAHVSEKRRKTSQMLKKRKIVIEIEPELLQLQKRILNFIGQQNSFLCQAFVDSDDNIDLAVWGDQQHLKVVLPYEDIKLDIYLDKLLPRIINIALNSTDRKTRVTACELLQAVVMVFLGTTKQMSQSGLSDLNELLNHVAFPLLQLGCDLDQVIEQLFRPLFFQLIHWYTHASQLRSEHCGIIVEAMMEGITHPTDSALRDFSGKCINEFVKWTIKQTSENNLASDPINIKILLKKMRFYSSHPDPFKKLGAALIFNNIYREVREEACLLSMFWIEFLHIFVKSLSTIENEETDEDTVTQINNALTHLQRGFIEKSDLFNKNDGNRRVPIDIKSDLLKDVVTWILSQTGSKSPHCRTKCIELFCNIAPHTKGYTTLQIFVSKNISKDSVWVKETYEAFLIQYPTLDCLSDHINPIKWMQAFLCALDGYNFVIKHNLVPLSKNILSSTFTTALQYFITNMSSITLDAAFALIGQKMWVSTTFEKHEFDKQKSRAVLKILELFNALLSDKMLCDSMNLFYTQDLWTLVLNMIFIRENLGFEPFIPSEDDHRLTLFIEQFMKKLPDNKILDLINVLTNYIKENFLVNINFDSHVDRKQRNIVKGLNILQSFNLKQLNLQNFSDGLVTTILNTFISKAEDKNIFVNELPNTTLEHYTSILTFALNNEEEVKNLINFLYEPFQVHTVNSHHSMNFGSYLLIEFEDSLVEKIIENFEVFLNFALFQNHNQTVEFILHILDYMKKKKHLRGINEYVVKNLLANWTSFEEYFNESFITIEQGIDFIKHLLPLMKICAIKNHNLSKWLSGLLIYENDSSWSENLDMKIEVFYLLVEIVDSTEVDINLQSNLEHMKNQFFVDSSAVPFETRIVSLDKLLCTISKIRSPEFLLFLLHIYIKTPTEDSNVNVQDLLTGYIQKNLESVQKDSLFKVYQMCYDEDADCFQKYKLITTIIPLFQHCRSSVFEEFFVTNITKILSSLEETINCHNLIEKNLHFTLIELLFLRSPINNSDDEISNITKAAFLNKPSNKALLLKLLKYTLTAIKDSFDGASELKELFRLYKCRAYNAMVSIISNSMKDENFYNKLFIRQENNLDILWTSLIDTTKIYVFENDFDTIPKKRKVLINIRDEIKARKKLEDNHYQSVKYADSLRIYNSSLSEDFSKFDFTNNFARSQSICDNLEDDKRVDHIQAEIELDCVDVNTHECMAHVCGLIEHMVKTGITELPTDDDEDYSPPAWVKGIRSLLLSQETHDNVKIFWVKVIDNTMHIFQHFAKSFLEPLLKFIVDKCAGQGINYFVTDVVSILASWSSKIVPSEDSEIQLASELITFLITNINNERQDMFKYHLELIKLLIEAWKSFIKVPPALINSKLKVDPTSRRVEVGIHLSSVLLANNIKPWEDDNIQDFCKTLFNIVQKSKHRTIYKPCAETIGLLLHFIRNDKYSSKIFGNIHVLLKKIEEPDKYAHVLEAIVLHHRDIADAFHLTKLLSRIHGIPKDLKVIYLKIILNRYDVMNTVDDFKNEKWNVYIENGSLEVQLLTLDIVYKCLDVLRVSDDFKCIIEAVCKHISHPNVLCRTRMYDIAILICQSIANGEQKYSEVSELCKDVLIQGIIDDDFELREKVLSFWQAGSNLPGQISKRFSYILENLYKTSTESDFLGYSSYLLLDILKRSENYNNLLFEHPLEDCDFEHYQLETNWRVRHLSVVPMFAETLRSFSEDHQFSTSHMDELRQTQTSLEFAPTQSVRMQQLTQFTSIESSLLVKPESSGDFVNPNLISMSYKYQVPKRRFLKDKAKIHKYFAQEQVNKSVKKVEERKDLAKERENKVTIYRKYRKGDLPDVQITLQAILEPLQALTLCDGEISKILYLEMFKNIIQKMEDDENFMSSILTGIDYIFNNSIQFNRNLFRALLDVVLLNKKSMIFQPNLIASVCQSSGLITLGVLLLEEYLISYDEDSVDSKKMRGCETKNEISYWVKLAELYKEMNEWDVVKSIFLQKMDCEENIKKALVAESQMQWKDAQDLYKSLIGTDETLEKRDFYYESYFKCFAHLGEWDNLVKSIDHVVSDSGDRPWDNLWDQGWNQQKLLPWYISGQLKQALFSSVSPVQFFLDLNKSLNSNHLEYIQNHFSEELAMLWTFKDDIDEAEEYVKIYIVSFLDDWKLLDPLYSNLRYTKLLKLRNVVDIQKFVQVYQNLNLDSEVKLKNLVEYWNRTTNENLPSILFNEERVLYRRQFVNSLQKKVNSFDEDDLKYLVTELNQVKFKLNESIISVALDQNNFYMTKKYLNSDNIKDKLKFCLSTCKLAYVKSTMLNAPDAKLHVLIEGAKQLVPIFKNSTNMQLNISAHRQLFTNLYQIGTILVQNSNLYDSRKSDILRIIENHPVSSVEDVVAFGAKKLELFLHKCENEINDKMEDETSNIMSEFNAIAQAYVELGYFAKERGREHFTDFIFFVLRAMKFNSSEGRQLFPCILKEQNFSEPNKALFIEEAEKIPLWMFLGWIPQLLVNIDSPKVSIVGPILLKIAKNYPQSIMYAYRLTKENFQNSSFSNETKALTEELDKLLLNDNRIDKFLKALSSVSVPAAMLLYYVRKMFKSCQTNDSEQVKLIKENILKEIFSSKNDSRSVESMQGNMFKKTEKFKKDFQSVSNCRTPEQLKNLIQKIDSELVKILKDGNENKKNSRLLKDYCPWLANFSAPKMNLDLEIPGQYDGKKMPLPQYHIKIFGFCPNVSVMPSLRKPIKITIVGNDTREYPYLIKFGEDIRQDQRIQQLFSLMNNIFENSKNFNGREFSIFTYQVVPLTTNLGIIQWINNTTSLQDFVRKPIKDPKYLNKYEEAYNIYNKWIYKTPNLAPAEAYGRAAKNYSREKTIPKFRSLVNMVPWDVLRSAFLSLSANTESFSALRTNFIKSYAVMCVSQWILGVGDRHLSNSLICLKNGKILGIDFGHAFGTATQILPVPELVPFRLTPHIVSLMEPLGEKGLFRETMIHCLRALRSNSSSLLATMNVFIEEPSLDWLEHASRFSETTDLQSTEWYPANKIDQAKRKLEGVNSTVIMVEDLKAGHKKNESFMNAYVQLVQGSPEFDLRARKEDCNLSVEDQVDCLIDHATDYNLLGRMFEGWAPWV